jgi:O-antigen/teichoic acid export membrane protein
MRLSGSLKTDTMVYLLGTGLYALCQWCLVVVIARVAGPAGLGIFAIATAIGAPIIVLSQMSMRQVLIADVSQRFRFAEYLLVRWALTIAAVLAITVVALAIGYRSTNLLAIVAFGTGRALESVSDIYYARSQAHGGLQRVSGYTGARGLVTLLMSGGTMFVTHNLLAASLAFVLASLFCQLAVRMIEGRLLSGEDDFGRPSAIPWALLIHAAPLAFAQAIGSLGTYAPRLILQDFGGERLAGQASAIEYFVSIGLLGVAALGQAASSPIAKAYHRGDRSGFVRLVGTISAGAAALAAGMALVALIAGRNAILLLYGPSFTQAANAAATIIAGGTLGYVASVLGYAVSATGRYERLMAWSCVGLAVTVIGSYLFVGRLGLVGLGYAFGMSGLFGVSVNIYLLWRAWTWMNGPSTVVDGEKISHE